MAEKVAIITGAGSGIGRATAIELSRSGYAVALVGRRQRELEGAASQCADAAVVPADVAEPQNCQLVVDQTLQRFGRLDALVHCAGAAPLATIERITPQIWRQIVDVNLSAAVFLAKAAWATFRGQNSGVIVNVSSEAARDPYTGLGAYGAAKAGVNLLGKALAAEGAELGVRVHTVAPGAVETGMLRAIFPPEQLSPSKALEPADVARVIVQCVSGDLRYTSGEVIYVRRQYSY